MTTQEILTPESVEEDTEYYTCSICGYESDDPTDFKHSFCLECSSGDETD